MAQVSHLPAQQNGARTSGAPTPRGAAPSPPSPVPLPPFPSSSACPAWLPILRVAGTASTNSASAGADAGASAGVGVDATPGSTPPSSTPAAARGARAGAATAEGGAAGQSVGDSSSSSTRLRHDGHEELWASQRPMLQQPEHSILMATSASERMSERYGGGGGRAGQGGSVD